MATIFNFTKASLAALQPTDKRMYYHDTREPHLGLYITPNGVFTYFARLTINGKTVRRPLGRFPDLSVPMARTKASRAATVVADGGDPAETKRRKKVLKITLEEVLENYLKERDLKPGTKKDYRRAIKENFGEWMNRPLSNITEKMVLARYLERGKVSKARTDNGARVLGALFRYAKARYKAPDGTRYFPNNPVEILSEAKVRFKPKRKRRIINTADLPEWWDAVNELDNPVSRDLLLFALFTGTRRTEAATLKWGDINLKKCTFQLTDTKNREQITLPLPQYIAKLLNKRKKKNRSDWVFPTDRGKAGYIADPRKSISTVRKKSKVEFSFHDLRRTFISSANGLDISPYTVKCLVNHKISMSDVTAGYDVPELERLHKASRRIESRLLGIVGERSAEVVPLPVQSA